MAAEFMSSTSQSAGSNGSDVIRKVLLWSVPRQAHARVLLVGHYTHTSHSHNNYYNERITTHDVCGCVWPYV